MQVNVLSNIHAEFTLPLEQALQFSLHVLLFLTKAAWYYKWGKKGLLAVS